MQDIYNMKTKIITTLAAMMVFFYSQGQTLFINDADLGSQLDGVRYASFSFLLTLADFTVDIKYDERGAMDIKDAHGKNWRTPSLAHLLNELDKIRPIKQIYPVSNGQNVIILVEFNLEPPALTPSH